MGPGIRPVIAQALRPPAVAQESLKPRQHFLSLAGVQDLHRAVQPLVPGADQLRVVHPAVGGFGGLFVGQQQPVGQVSVFFIDHAGEVMVRQFRHIPWVEMLISRHGYDRLSASVF